MIRVVIAVAVEADANANLVQTVAVVFFVRVKQC